MTQEYDWRQDYSASWALAIVEKRKAGLLSGKFQPRNDEEREILAKGREDKP